MNAAKVLLTAEEFDNYPFEEDKRYELIDGELVEMSRPAYWHNVVLQNLNIPLALHCRQTKIGEVLISENLYAISPSTRLAPDLAVILGNRRAELRHAKVIPIIPDIAVEILSPSETRRMINRKLTHYFKAGVKEVWVIDPESREAEIWTSLTIPEHTLTSDDSLESPLLPGFSLKIAELFV